MSSHDEKTENINRIARSFAAWSKKIEGLDARQVLAGLGHLGSFLKAISDPEIDLELGPTDFDHSWNPLGSVGDNDGSQFSAVSSTPEHSTVSEIQLPRLVSLENDDDASELFKAAFSPRERKVLKELGFLNPSEYPVIVNGKVSEAKADYENARSLSESQWIFPRVLRQSLYYYLFIAKYSRQSNTLTYENLIRAQVALIRELQRFMLHLVCAIDIPEGGELPSFRFLVQDAITMLQILQAPLSSNKYQEVEKCHPFHHFDQQRYQSWKDLGFSEENLETFWEDYKIDLCDALLGVWHPLNEASLLYERGDSYSIRSILSCVDLTPRQSKSVPELSSSILDASFIVSNGPFRFKHTRYLHEHLTIRKTDIFIFTDLEKLAAMRHHAVLKNESPLCMFDILTSEDRYAPPRTVNIRPSLSRLHYSVQASLFLLFFQHPVSRRAHRKNLKIAKSLGIHFNDVNDIKILSDSILGDHPTWESFLDRTTEARLQDPFMIPLDKLYATLTSWKPRRFWEMRYPGYGNVDVVSLYGFYFGIMVGVAAIIALMLTAAQTYTGFKGLSVGQ